MVLKLYSIHDKKAGTWSPPYVAPTDTHALRSFRDAVNNEDANNSLRNYPQDFELNLVGAFDDETGTVEGTIPRLMLTAESVVNDRKEKNPNG